MFEQSAPGEQRNPIGDWALRGAVALAFVFIGWAKFDAQSMWPGFFQQVGIGQWFRYFTGVVEVLGGVLVLIPWTATIGLALLAVTMLGAALIWIFPMHQPGNFVIPLVVAIGLGTSWYSRRSHL